MAVLTESDVRRLLKKEHLTEMIIAKGTIITPSARGFLSERGIDLVMEGTKLHQEEKNTENKISVEEKAETVVEMQIPTIESYTLKKIRIQWSLFKLEVVKTQQIVMKLGNEAVKDDLQLVIRSIDAILESLVEGNWVNTNYLIPKEANQMVKVDVEMNESHLELSRLTLLCEDVCCETVTAFSNSFGTNLREDLVEIEEKLPLYIQSLIN